MRTSTVDIYGSSSALRLRKSLAQLCNTMTWHPSDTETRFALADVLHAPLFADVKLGGGCQ